MSISVSGYYSSQETQRLASAYGRAWMEDDVDGYYGPNTASVAWFQIEKGTICGWSLSVLLRSAARGGTDHRETLVKGLWQQVKACHTRGNSKGLQAESGTSSSSSVVGRGHSPKLVAPTPRL